MNNDNKKNLKRLVSAFIALLVIFFGVVTASVSLKFWWASLPTSGMAIAAAVFIFKKGFFDKELEE